MACNPAMQVTMCEQLTCYLGKFVSSNTAAAAATGGEARVVAPDGMKVCTCPFYMQLHF